MVNSSSYEQDFYAWAMKNAQLLRDKKFAEIDVEHVAEELEDMGKSEKRQLINRLAVLIAHLFKWQYQPDKRSRSWQTTIEHQRLRVKKLLQESPSLKHGLEEKLLEAYEEAVYIAAEETRLPKEHFPQGDAYSLAQLLDDAFFPG